MIVSQPLLTLGAGTAIAQLVSGGYSSWATLPES